MSADTRSSTSIPPAPSDFAARRAYGRAARVWAPRSSHAGWTPPADRVDPIALLEEQAESRVPALVPVRYGRMKTSPFTFYRGAALLMAADLARTPRTDLTVQLCGDAHLLNFGLFGSPERRLVFDINDFDETLPGPFEWDVKRLVASFEVATRHRGFDQVDRRAIVLSAARGYRERMLAAADATVLDAWYDHLDAEQARQWLRGERDAHRAAKEQERAFSTVVAKARTKDRLRAFAKLVDSSDDRMRIIADPPLVVPVEDVVAAGGASRDVEREMRDILAGYQRTLPTERHPLEEYTYVHMARKVVGVGSVGTRAWIVLLRGRDDADPLFLQAKEAQPSVLERFVGKSIYASHGERVVRGQRIMQASSDIFLGWQRVTGDGGIARDFYIRQLHDWKGSLDPEQSTPRGMLLYARICGETLARAHARSGDRVTVAAYLGVSESFDHAIADFAAAYADQNEADYRAFMDAIASGRLTATEGL
ncbi:MAG: DUF2252 domain-containing protein [Actinobacteria bacterium]|nr:DUF2252 domain-containing protein [Actinomycetota bacterium]